VTKPARAVPHWARRLTFRRPPAADLAHWGLAKEAMVMSTDGLEAGDLMRRVERLERRSLKIRTPCIPS
jgi:hypothetical protein